MTDYNRLSQLINSYLLSTASANEKLTEIASLLHSHIEKYTWVGFYFMDHKTSMLHLGPFSGMKTEHTTIPFGKGICGQVALSGETYTAENVSAESNYIACSLDVRSEMVVPIYNGPQLIAQLDIDSNMPSAFTAEDREFLEKNCLEIGKKIEWHTLTRN